MTRNERKRQEQFHKMVQDTLAQQVAEAVRHTGLSIEFCTKWVMTRAKRKMERKSV